MRSIYLDNNATSKVSAEVTQEMLPLLDDQYGNPSSQHYLGKEANELLQIARSRVAKLIGCSPTNIIFTSSGTESNNLAIKGFARKLKERKHFVTSSVEHPSVIYSFQCLEEEGHTVTYLPVDSNGEINLDQLEDVISRDTVLISFMLANNETGVIFPVEKITQIAKKYKIPVHCDAVQGIGKLPVGVDNLNVDFLSLSAHKIYGPKGAAALYVRDLTMIDAVISGTQENGKRGGTQALPAIVGLGKACEIINKNLEETIGRMSEMRRYFESQITANIPGSRINGVLSPRICNTSNILFNEASDALLNELSNERIYASHGSACASNGRTSQVLSSMGLSQDEIRKCVRFSISRETTKEELDETVKIITELSGRASDKTTCNSCEIMASENEKRDSQDIDYLKDLEVLWSETQGDSNICIAVLDGPVDLSHPCFAKARIKTIDTIAAKPSGSGAASSHGTHVASMIFGQHGSGVPGIAPLCTGLIAPIFSDGAGNKIESCSQLDLSRAIIQAVNEGANIINISGGQFSPSGEADEYLSRAVRICAENNVLLVAAAGNDGCECLHVPAALPSVLVVGAMNKNGPMALSNWGAAYRQKGILAPGENILGALPGGGVGRKTGTSFSTPIVTGVIGILMSFARKKGYHLDSFKIKDILLETAYPCDEASADSCQKYLTGKLNIQGALKRLSQIIENEKASSGSKISVSSINSNKEQEHGSQVLNSVQRTDNQFNYKKGRFTNMNEKENNLIPNEVHEIEAAQMQSQANLSMHEVKSTPSSGSNNIYPSSCGDNAPLPKAYVIGTIGYDFGTEARRDYFIQRGVNPFKPAELLNYLHDHKEYSNSVIWTLNQDQTPIYAIQPFGPFAYDGYQLLRSFLWTQINEGAERISVPGFISSKYRLLNGQEVPGLFPDLRGMYSWSLQLLLKSLTVSSQDDGVKEGLKDFLNRIYYEVRNLGLTSQERALNYAATNIYQVEQVFVSAYEKGLSLQGVSIEKSTICRPGSDCWDIKLTFFNPLKRYEEAKTTFRFTVDVSDVVPVSVGDIRSWSEY